MNWEKLEYLQVTELSLSQHFGELDYLGSKKKNNVFGKLHIKNTR